MNCNYIIDGNIDFHNELKMLDIEDESDSDETCLISHMPLVEPIITLECGHKFNYLPLYLEVCQQKGTRLRGNNPHETTRLLKNQVKCPYCRSISNFILPYFPIEGVEKQQWVNFPKSHGYYPNKCSYIFKNGKNKGKSCDKCCHGNYCLLHYKKEQDDCKKVNKIIKSNNICKAIIKSGKRKGECCGCKITTDSSSIFCKRHKSLVEKST